jgi:hypothetical protein
MHSNGGHKSIYINSKLIIWNTIDYSGHEKLFGGPSVTPTCASDRNYTKSHSHYGQSEAEESTIRDQARTIWPQAWTVRSLKNQKNPKVIGSVKCIFSVLMDRLGCTTGPFATALSDI